MSSLRSRAAAVSTGIAVIAAGTLSALPAQAVSGTPATPNTYAFTAKLTIGTGDTTRACTGTLIAAGWIATASSCFANGTTPPVTGKPTAKATATVGRTDLTTPTGGHTSDIIQIVVHEQRDLVLARLAQPTTIAPAVLATAPAAPGDTLKTAGYGRTRTEWVPNTLHTAAFTANSVNPTDLTLTAAGMNDAICRGDAGAPILREAGGTTQLLGIVTKSSLTGCLGEATTPNTAAATRVDDLTLASGLTAGRQLKPGGMLIAGPTTLTMRTDGDLTLTSAAGKTLWNTGTTGNPGATAQLDTTGNLTVRTADGTTALWESKTTAPGGTLTLTPRGNLLIHNNQQQSVWSSGTALRHDHNGDGRSDVGAWYAFPNAVSDALYTFPGQPGGSLGAPVKSFTSSADDYNMAAMKFVSGDFNGDGRGDMVALHGYGDTSVKAFLFPGLVDGGFGAPVQAWAAAASSEYHISYMTPQAGDFNGDGRDDMAVWFADTGIGATKLVTFTSKPTGTFNSPFTSWTAPAGSWLRSSTKFVSGDFNGDGREELGVFYKQGAQGVKAYVFDTLANGGFGAPGMPWWESTAWKWEQALPQAGDFDGDGHDDVLVWYAYDDGSDRTSTMLFEKVDGKERFGSATVSLDGAKAYDVARLKMITGDYDGDGRDDLAVMNHAQDDSVRMITWTARPDAKFNGGLAGWSSNPGAWSFPTTKLLAAYN
ncbi:FG-GAP-like repeat-containing protein [Streptomyces sp. NPDC046887]|uniref:FG-GAP-like repeat-containing protein n=1 Tax=Streptomyces sp. NPDC046887 TaxID=3155472 RepID=UPI0033D495DC